MRKNAKSPAGLRNNSYRLIGGILLLLFAGIWLVKLFKPRPVTIRDTPTVSPGIKPANSTTQAGTSIDELTRAAVVVPYVKKHGQLPDYYITKKQARQQGWQPGAGNLCDVLPGRAIGGDYFSNREGRLPKAAGRQWMEADIDYHCGSRNAHRLLYSSDGLLYITYDHYKTFIPQ
ncbi:MAG: hypothetical protein RL172_1252 [Bacteroidota bacterium]